MLGELHAGAWRLRGTQTYSTNRISPKTQYNERQHELSRHSRAETCRAAFHVEVVITSCSLVLVFVASVAACFDQVCVCEARWAKHTVRRWSARAYVTMLVVKKTSIRCLQSLLQEIVVLVCDGNDRGGRVFNVAKEMLQCGDDAVVCCLFRAVLASNAEAASSASGEHDASIGFLPVLNFGVVRIVRRSSGIPGHSSKGGTTRRKHHAFRRGEAWLQNQVSRVQA